ncbi:flagellin [Cobetia sp. 5-11-6-3]|uniref:flagellin N-terminal helical domain-containing protein n=1 Tax=Cobetia sp. 5-11-6-3 TaxID=2737458 RepID=UPI001596F8A5|nr:flagellin [Cobetia sp. 5-11-6-3]
MASVINTNTLSMVTQQNLNQSQNALNTSMERLSSGMRINSAKDDAAGQAIANRMDSQITGLSQAQRNANDGISVAQTAEGALNQVNDNLQRVRELTVQAQNGTNNADDLSSIQNEIDLRLEEITRISEQTSFNGIDVLQEDNTMSIQVGANDGEVIKINLKQINAETLGLTGFNVDGSGEVDNDAATADSLSLAGFDAAASANANGSVTYTKDTVTANNQLTSSDLMSQLDDGATVSLNSTGATGFEDNGNTSIGFNSASNITYSATNDNFTYDVEDASATSVATKLTPAAGEGARAATISIGGSTTEVLIQENGSITNTNSEALYIDGSGNLTATTSGADTTYADATVDNLTAAMQSQDAALATAINSVDGAALDLTGTDIEEATITLKDSGTKFTGQAFADGIDVTGAVADKTNVENMLAQVGGDITLANDLTVTDDDSPAQDVNINQFSVAAGGLVSAGETAGNLATNDAIYMNADGDLTEATETTKTTTYYAQENGMVTDDTGAQVYVGQDDALTMDAVTEGEATPDPLAALDAALKNVDSMRSELGAVQNRFDSAITNLATTETNLASAQSRIQDADYAEEVSSMTTAQILQQAGTSMLTQANQVPQNVLSLLG